MQVECLKSQYKIQQVVLKNLRELYVNYRRLLLRYVGRYLSPEEAEDVVHDCFLRYYEKYNEEFTDNEALKILLFIAHNLCIDRIRAATRAHDYQTKVRSKLSLDELTSEQDEHIEALDTKRFGLVMALVRQLPDRQQEILKMYYLENLTIQEIAIGTGLARRTVENTIYRALMSLRKQV